jgi:hypothetical protein
MRTAWPHVGTEQRGSIFLGSLVLVAIMTLLGVALFDLVSIEAAMNSTDKQSGQLLYCAEGALGRTMVDSAGRMGQISAALLVPGATLTWSETTSTNDITCANTITFTDDTANKRRLLQATSTAPNGARRSVRIQLNFLPLYFQYAVVADNGDFYLSGSGGAPVTGPGGADVINGDIFINGRAYIGSPSVTCSGGTCGSSTACASGTTCSSSSQVNPRSAIDGTPTVSVPKSSTWTLALADHSTAWPTNGDTSPFGKQEDLPQPDVTGYVSALKSSVQLSGNSQGSMTGMYQGSPVYNLSAIFAAFGRNSSDGSLRQPSGCGCNGIPSGDCAIYCQLQPLAIKKNPGGSRASMTSGTPEDDYFIDGVAASEQFPSRPNLPDWGAQRLMSFVGVSGQPPVLLADGNVWFNHTASLGWAVQGRGLVVATNDVIIGDNLIYKSGLGPAGGCSAGSTDPACVPGTADMLGIISQRDIWYGDPLYGTFHEGSGIMLAGRDFNFVFFDASGNPKTPDASFILNGTMLANRQVAVFRDFANPSGSSSKSSCDSGTTSCRPVAFDPSNTSCGSTNGCWRFIVRNSATGLISFDTSTASFKECGPTASSCSSGSRRISHYQMQINYDARLFANPMLQAPGLSVQVLTGLPGANFANSWKNWQECPPCN